MSTNAPDPRASARGLLALALDQARVDPDRRPSADMRQWLVDFAIAIGEGNVPLPRTNRDLVTAALRLQRVVDMRAQAEAAEKEAVAAE